MTFSPPPHARNVSTATKRSYISRTDENVRNQLQQSCGS
jgi:hypothetical protein